MYIYPDSAIHTRFHLSNYKNKNQCENIYSNFMHESQKLEKAQVSMNGKAYYTRQHRTTDVYMAKTQVLWDDGNYPSIEYTFLTVHLKRYT